MYHVGAHVITLTRIAIPAPNSLGVSSCELERRKEIQPSSEMAVWVLSMFLRLLKVKKWVFLVLKTQIPICWPSI
jgi:hypothetical protein